MHWLVRNGLDNLKFSLKLIKRVGLIITCFIIETGSISLKVFTEADKFTIQIIGINLLNHYFYLIMSFKWYICYLMKRK